ncbi:MAG: tetratricopeptide repeat protein, partial [Isosphaeraceae bacterium]|nr:tetratricopeptide repeat protein [Isosphaeraceae bacterium]
PAPPPRPVVEPATRSAELDALLTEFTARWERGEEPCAEEYLDRISPEGAIELIYHEFCLAEAAGIDPDPIDYLHRFPEHRRRLERLFGLHEALGSSHLRRWAEPAPLPEVGDAIGPYRLVRELGRGAFARVFLAEQADLDDRLVVVKVSARASPEPRLLARARHAHIVEVLRHGTADDGALHLICMPFLGGATVAEVLAERSRRGRRPRSGRDLLADLDRVAAREHPGPGASRPAREILKPLSYPRACAWIVARLAEALDHAHRRGVTHGDLKPSNILLTADAQPMLFDFNLAVDWRAAGTEGSTPDGGGTLAYMAPERLQALADPRQAPLPRAADRHRADLYALGLVLRELLTGSAPIVPQRPGVGTRELAAALASVRERGPIWPPSERRLVPAALRAILARCLAPDPIDRYVRAAELAEDLDRWRTDRRLAFAEEPLGACLLRWARRRRRPLAAGLVAVVAGAVAAGLVDRASRGPIRQQALDKLAAILDRSDSGAIRYQQASLGPEPAAVDPAALALRHLERYEVLAADDWRLRAEVRALPPEDRLDLEAWILEQAWRLAEAMRQRPESPGDWRRALLALERAAGPSPPGPIETQRQALHQQLGLPDPPPAAHVRAPRWLEAYLRGVEAEADHPREAMRWYGESLALRPGGFWPHYRAAATAYRLGEYAAAVNHLEACIARRPENPTLRGQLAGCLFEVNRLDEALKTCDQAVLLDPDVPEVYRTRAFIRGRLGQAEGLEADLDRFALLTRVQGKVPALLARLDLMLTGGPGLGVAPVDRADLPRRILAAAPERADVRTVIAWQHCREGRWEEALAELDQALDAAPDHFRARFQRALLLHRLRPDEATNDFLTLIGDPRFEEIAGRDHRALRAFHLASEGLLRRRQVDQALDLARRGLASADRLGASLGESEYALARALAVAAQDNPNAEPLAAHHLQRACHLNPVYTRWFAQEPLLIDRPLVERLIRKASASPSAP